MPARRHRYSAPLLVGVALSLFVHFGVIVPALVAVMTARTEAAPRLESDFDPDDVAPLSPEEPEIQLGKPESEHSTLVWLGHEEYQEHLAALSAVEQAAFDERPHGATPAVPAPPTPEVPQNPTAPRPPGQPSELAAVEPLRAPSEQPAEQPNEAEIEVERETPSEQPRVLAEVDAPDAQPTPLPADTIVSPDQPAGATSAPRANAQGDMLDAVALFLQQMLSTAQQAAEQMASSETAGKQAEHAAPTDTTASTSDAAPAKNAEASESDPASNKSAAAPRVTATQPSSTPANPGEQQRADQADQESDPAAEVPLDDIKIGKPVVTQGLELKPRKPTFTNLVRMTSLPGNPLCEIRFQSNGKPALAQLLTSSGDSRVDDAVLASLYRWRAEGPELAALGASETINIRIRIILNGR